MADGEHEDTPEATVCLISTMFKGDRLGDGTISGYSEFTSPQHQETLRQHTATFPDGDEWEVNGIMDERSFVKESGTLCKQYLVQQGNS